MTGAMPWTKDMMANKKYGSWTSSLITGPSMDG